MNKICYLILFASILLFNTTVLAQTVVTGLIIDENGMGIPGATILEEGTSNGSSSDFDGNYSIKISSKNAVLQYSYVGYVTQSIKVNNKKVVNITLFENTEELDQVVVVGYQSIRKSDLTGSVSQLNIETEELSEIPANSVEELLIGRIPGLVIGNPSDAPGAGLTVRIRGASSFTATTPLIVVDGFPLGDAGNLQQINPIDIVSVEVLKDASAASIYGSRGANGVILITTRRGKEGKMKVSFSALTTVSTFSSEFDSFTNPVDLAVLTDESRVNSGLTPIYVGAEDVNGTFFPSIQQLRAGFPTTDYIDFSFRNPINYNYNVSITGGNENTKYNFGLNFITLDGAVTEDNLSKTTANFGIDQNLTNRLSVSSNIVFSRSKRNDNSGLSFNRNLTFPIFDEDGNFFRANDNDFGNPAALTALRVNETTSLDLTSSSILLWDITDELQFKSQFNYSLGSSFQERFFPSEFTQLGNEGNGVGFNDNFQNQRVVTDAYFTYDKKLGDYHKITLLGGYSNEYFDVRTSQLRAQDFVNQSLGAGNLSLGANQRVANNFLTTTLNSGISRVNYTYANKVLLTYTGRVDGSSNFGANNRWAFFPSGAISWKMQNEGFIRNGLPFINEFKPRVSWGIVGNQAIGPFETLNRLGEGRFFNNGGFVTTVGPGIINNNGIFVESRGLGNPDLKWETTEVFNVGLDFAAFNKRVSFNIDYYNKITDDLLVDSNLPPSSGFDFLRINAGKIENKGIEVGLNMDLFRGEDFQFSAGIIFNKNENKVISLGPSEFTSVLNDEFGNQFRFTGVNFRDQFRSSINTLVIGQPINVFYGARVRGIIQSEAEGLANGLTGVNAQAGEFLYEDLNGDGVVEPFGADRTVIGDPNPDFVGSLSLNLSYKRWSLSTLFNASFGGDAVHINQFSTQAGGGSTSNQLQRWTPDNRSNEFPSLRETRNVAFSDWWIQDGSFVKVQNLRVRYDIDTSGIKYLAATKFYVNVDNLYNFTEYTGLDPEINPEGIDENSIPRLRKFTFGVEVSF
ncbi:TonB-dependent receptor [Aquimarina sp. RZ0]|uniref:SusC/RagA family TonB-linked outer membrane protein n=1 Tax=Aquimarina sp. RZ0 TaxID=2607730 RepID=UPI0011F3AAB2|nr:TonB-dependent receptor [Aquimarina sp. RZ0]KAA1243697.1 TonB-dependent receptor [Aquimarina sp. RZ0]